MKNNSIYAVIFFMLVLRAAGQQTELNLAKGGTALFHGSLYTYGLSASGQKLSFCMYKADLQLKLKDSLVVPLSKTNADSYLNLSYDTLHNYLNIYLQEKEKKRVTVFRFNAKFERIATVENVDVARLNNTVLFTGDALYSKNEVYAIKIQNDTAGKQFYLNRYSLKSELQNFDYELKWQFAFEKKEIRSAHIFYADKNQVLIYVHVSSGIKTGQWVLKINAATGKLIRGTKLNSRGETNTYLFGNCIADSVAKTLIIAGQKFTETQFKETDNKLSISNRAFALMYVTELDSTGDIIAKQEFKIPVVSPATGAKKTSMAYLFQIVKAEKNKEGVISLESDIYGSSVSPLCYFYMNTLVLRLLPADDKLLLEKTAITTNQLIEKFYVTSDQLDANGRLCTDSLSQFEKLFYKSLVFPVKQRFKYDEANNPFFILSKTNFKKSTISYTLLQPVKKIYGLTLIDEPLKAINPVLIPISDKSFLISTQPAETKYQLKLFTW